MKKLFLSLVVLAVLLAYGCSTQRKLSSPPKSRSRVPSPSVSSNFLQTLLPPPQPAVVRLLPPLPPPSTNPAPPYRFKLVWGWVPTNGPVEFHIWMATNVQGPFSLIGTSAVPEWHGLATNKQAFFHVTSYNTGLVGLVTNVERDSGWIYYK